MRKKTRQLLAAGMAFVMTWSSFGMTAPVYAETVGTGQTEEALKASDSNAEDSRARNVASDADAGKAPEESVVPETKTAQKEQIALFAGGIIEGTGTVSDPYLIADADDWKAVMSKENQTYNRYGNLQGHIALSSDIDLSGETWDAENLNGKTFDGRGHKISGIGQPLFETVNGTVKNLVISGVSIEETNAGTPVGAIAGKTSKTVNIQNCYVRGKLSNTSYAVGGLVGDVSGGTTSVEIKNCVVDAKIINSGDIQKRSLAGGLIGNIPEFGTTIRIEQCITLGTVETDIGRGCGGLVGGQNKTVTINRCAALQETVKTSGSSAFVGRIFGYGGNYVNGEKNYAYAGMSGGANGTFAAYEAVNGEDVSREDCLKADFWNNTIGWGNDANWEIADEQFPILKTSGISPVVDLTDGQLPVYLGGAKIQLSDPANVRWDETVNGKAVWDEVENADGYQVQLYKDSVVLGSEKTVSGQTSYDFTSEIKETGSYTFKVKAIGNENYETSAGVKSAAYNFTAQSLADVKTAAENTLKKMSVTNGTTAAEILQAVTCVITNDSISAAWSEESGFTLTKATDGIEPGDNGGITGTITLTLRKEGVADETENLTVDLTILPKFTVTFKSGSETASGTAPTWESKMEGTTVTLPENPFTVYEKMFSGWKDSDGKVYSAGSAYKMPRRNVTFTAMWEHDVWDGSTKTEPKRDDNRYYLISTGAELAWFQGGTHAIGKAKLVCDIDLGYHDFVPISNSVAEFDGCGHTIHGLKAVNNGVYAGLFSNVSGACLIKDLTIKDARVKPA